MNNDQLGMKSFIEGVIKCNTLAGNSLDDKELIPVYEKLLNEEIFGKGELLDSFHNMDKVGTLDGICDVMVVGWYLILLSFGKDMVDSNLDKVTMSYKVPVDEYEDFRLTGLIHDVLLKDINDCPDVAAFTSCLNTAVSINMLNFFDLKGALEEVNKSNLSKFPKVGKVNPEAELEYIRSKGRYGDLSYKVVDFEGEQYYSFLAGKDLESRVAFEKPKWVKPSTFVEPDFSKYIT